MYVYIHKIKKLFCKSNPMNFRDYSKQV